MKSFVIGLVVALACAAPATAARYFLISHDQKATTLVDRDAIRRKGGSLLEAPLVAIRPEAGLPGAGFDYGVLTTEYDCGQHQIAAGKATLYLANGQLAPQQPPDKPLLWGSPQSGTAADAALAFVCAPRRERAKLGVSLHRMTLVEIVSKVRAGADLEQAAPARHRRHSR